MEPHQTRARAAALGAALFCVWTLLEMTQANERLTSTEMQAVVGGIDGCSQFSTDQEGYKCNNTPSMSCGLICSKCASYSSNEGLCVNWRCWNCANGTGSQIKECIVGQEEDECRSFGSGPQSGVCGFEYSRYCQYDAGEERCYCQTPLDASDLACARKNCESL